MKTARLIALVCSLVFCSSSFCDGEAKAGFPPEGAGQAEKAIKVTTEIAGKPVTEVGQGGKDAGFLKRVNTKEGILMAFSLLFASAFGLGLVGELFRAPEGYENETGFHLRTLRAKRTDRARHGRRLLPNSSARRVPPRAPGGGLRMLASNR